ADARYAPLTPDYYARVGRGPCREVDAAGVHAVPDEIGEGAGASAELDRSGGGDAVWAGSADELLHGVEGAAAVSAGVDAPRNKGDLPRLVRGWRVQDGVNEGS